MRIITVLVVATLSLLATGPVSPQDNPSSGLRMRLLMPDPKVCIGAKKIDLEAAVKNTSSEPVSFSPSGMGSGLSFSSHHVACQAGEHVIASVGAEHLSGSGIAIATGDMPWFLGSSSSPRVITVRPGETYWFSSSIPWNFDGLEPGIYDVSVGLGVAPIKPNPSTPILGVLHSNDVYLELQDCGNGNPPRTAH
jgi:hypothetical protein